MRIKRLTVLALAAAYLAVATCRFACAVGVSAAGLPSVSVQGDGMPCCRHDGAEKSKKRHAPQAPCCMGRAGEFPALAPGAVAVARACTAATLIIAASVVEAPAAKIPFAQSQGPPPAAQILGSSSLSPRAPPFLLAVL